MDLRENFRAIFDFKWHPVAKKYLESEAQTRVMIKGNQGGGTALATHDAALRVLGLHPVKRRNVLNKPIRFVSKVLPNDHDDEQNQQFVEFRRFIPPELWKQKLTARSKVGKIQSLYGKINEVEFMASTQEIDAFMSVQRSAYYQDEEIERLKWDENQMRLLAEGGDTTLTMTPVKGLDWSFDSLWKRARLIWRSKIICNKFNFPVVERLKNDTDIEVFCWATDDNPALNKETIDNIFADIDDEDDLAMRRYGVFRQVSGRIYKVFDTKYHVVSFDKFFDADLFRRYWHFRVIDYHPAKPWYVTWIAVSPTHEWFVWNEMVVSHDKKTVFDVRDEIKAESLLDEDEEYNRCTLIDPLAKTGKIKSGTTIFDELSMGESGLRRCRSADTKDHQVANSHRAQVKTRLKNALICQVPGNNLDYSRPPDIKYGQRLPTLWFLDNCKGHINHFNSWRYIDYKQAQVRAVRIVKKEAEKWSDFCRNVEFLAALNPVWYEPVKSNWSRSELFQGQMRRTA